mmetsp:Transcript_82894/g.243031  ORF Transcript_82894/g.243031 Transcript_82894/m.243031 type:complete len:209 (-) Transcript_82894:886-1512(-)
MKVLEGVCCGDVVEAQFLVGTFALALACGPGVQEARRLLPLGPAEGELRAPAVRRHVELRLLLHLPMHLVAVRFVRDKLGLGAGFTPEDAPEPALVLGGPRRLLLGKALRGAEPDVVLRVAPLQQRELPPYPPRREPLLSSRRLRTLLRGREPQDCGLVALSPGLQEAAGRQGWLEIVRHGGEGKAVCEAAGVATRLLLHHPPRLVPR